MNGSVKFRVYDYRKNKLLSVIELDWYPDHTLRYLKAVDKDNHEYYYDTPKEVNGLTLEQSTGVTDIKGSMIFVGDLVLARVNDEWQKEQYLIKHFYDPYLWEARYDPNYAIRAFKIVGNKHNKIDD